MNGNSNILKVRHLLLYLAFIFFFAGCGKVRSFEQKLFQKPPGNLHSVTITWTPSTSRVAGYNVYRTSPPSSDAFVKLTPQPINANRYTDPTAVGGLTYGYYTTAVDAKGIESKASNLTTAVIPYP